jgi:RHS repeat-associated protein
MPGRNFSSSSYRYGFNGQEKDDEIKGVTGSSLEFKYRIYDSRIGKFLSVDPLSPDYPWYTPYQFAGNTPVWAYDLEGLEPGYTSWPSPGTNSAAGVPHTLQGITDGYGDVFVRKYGFSVKLSKVTAKEAMMDLAKHFSSYTTGVSYFEKINGDANKVAVGDEFFITGGLTYASTNLDNSDKTGETVYGFSSSLWKKQRPDLIGDDNVLHNGEVKTGVTVLDFSVNEETGSFSFTFGTWDEHVEAGKIKFSFSQNDKGGFDFSIQSATKSSNWLTDKAYRFGGGMAEQTNHWMTVMKNIVNKSGGELDGDYKLDTKTIEN